MNFGSPNWNWNWNRNIRSPTFEGQIIFIIKWEYLV